MKIEPCSMTLRQGRRSPRCAATHRSPYTGAVCPSNACASRRKRQAMDRAAGPLSPAKYLDRDGGLRIYRESRILSGLGGFAIGAPVSLPTVSEARLSTVLDTALVGIAVVDTSGQILTFNKTAERLFGYHASEVLGRNVSMLLPPEYARQNADFVAA